MATPTTNRTASSTRTFDDRTEKNLATLLPAVVPTFRAFLAAANDAMAQYGITVKAIDGSRTYEQQNALYAKGRTAPGPKVTNASAGQSLHNFGIALDIGLFKGGNYLTESPYYKTLGAIGVRCGLEWGGNWKTIVDEPHYQYPTGLTLAQLRDRAAKGIPIVHVTEPAPTPATKVWSVETEDGEQIVSNCLDTAAVRAVTEKAFGGSIGVDSAKKVITVYRPR